MKISDLTSGRIRPVSAVLAVLFALPLFWGSLTGIYAWFSPFIMFNSIFVLKSFVFMYVLGFITLLLSFIYKRWFCRFLCPVGFGCDLVSQKSKRKNFKLNRIPKISKGLAIVSLSAALLGLPLFILLDPMAIFHGFFTVFTGNKSFWVIVSLSGFPILLGIHFFFPGIWCARICPLGGLQELLNSAKKFIGKITRVNKKESAHVKFDRRLFISSGMGLAAGLMIPGYIKPSAGNYIRPPSSLSPGLFNTLCIRCGNCIKSCPTGIIHNNADKTNPVAWMTPVVHFDTGYCLESCTICGKVCPSGAISAFSVENKKQIAMALAVIHTDDCLLTEHNECDRCKEVCKYDAVEISFQVSGNYTIPVVHEDKCVGCGACAVICPPFTIEMIPV